ncbi:MAG: protein phosphatase 2C domain-containing protein, partial [Candidatus Cloacimonetes bacterium]|nr:protein phosphatase 2C domain-containing protein [Candidatus Cloacimonadota bacterium]
MQKHFMVIMNTDTEPIYKFEHASFFQKSIYRDVNHDFYGVYSGDYGKIYVISKGFGREGTEIISELAINAVKSHFEKLSGSYSSVTAIKHSFQAASQAILTYSADRTFFKNYGACLSLILINHDGMFFGNVGDCKIALLRKGKLEYVTKYNNAYKDLSIVDNNEVLAKISKNPVFTEAIGVTCERPEIIADIEIEKNDCFLIATKGVFQRVTRLEIQNAFTMWDLSEGLETVRESAQNKKSYD